MNMKDITVDNIIRSQNVEDLISYLSNNDLNSISDLLANKCTLTNFEYLVFKDKTSIINYYNEFNSTNNFENYITHNIFEDIHDTLISEYTIKNKKILYNFLCIYEFNNKDQITNIREFISRAI